MARITSGGESDKAAHTPVFEYAARYRVIRLIAKGGMASVYLAEQVGESGFAKTVALKVISPGRLKDPSAVRLFFDEARLTADLVHQNIVQVYNLATYRDHHFIVMEFIHGLTARDLVHRLGQQEKLPPVNLAAFIVSRVCRALAYAHDKRDRRGRKLGIVHRDVTPTNVMIDYRGFVKLSDFGIAKALTMSVPDESKIVMGKFPYMSPEQARGEITDGRTDVFSLGLVLHELLTGKRLYEAKSRKELLALAASTKVRSPSVARSSVPKELTRITLTAIALDADKRFQTAKEFGDALELYMYSGGYGPTNEKLAEYLLEVFPEVDRDRIE